MELKDVILSTLAEMEDTSQTDSSGFEVRETKEVTVQETTKIEEPVKDEESSVTENELMFLNSIRERLLVLFEGFQAPNNKNIEAKIDMTLNFLEYTLATIDTRIEKLEKGKR